MADYIKREDAYKTIKHLLYETAMNNMKCAPQFAEACEDIAENRLEGYMSAIPAADVRENVRGHWTNVQIYVTGSSMADCSICGVTVHNSFMGNAAPNFCPNCGADCRGDSDE